MGDHVALLAALEAAYNVMQITLKKNKNFKFNIKAIGIKRSKKS